ncbi:MAG: type II toxin-antitoxin system RelE/ParE family toxin [Coriobacteriia bacterium]|jgi:plasmid stabilization system protein ParE|nr:type II toxin-antitoxin system RelE/ParE family toxin [Coriobacteriia bacterium]
MAVRRCEVEFARSAQDDLDDIVAWYTSQQVPEVGLRLVGDIIERVEQLETFPESGRVVPEFDLPWLRELELAPFRIVYRHDDPDTVSVVRVRRSQRLMGPDIAGNV